MNRGNKRRREEPSAGCIAFPAACVALLFSMALSGGWHTARAGWTIIGTTVREDAWTGVPDVRVTLFPESLTVISDEQGDFFVPWTGDRGWLTFVPGTPDPSGAPWCKRYALEPRAATQADSTLDIGRIYVVPGVRMSQSAAPIRPPGVDLPQVVHVPGPASGQSDSCWVRFRFFTDIWGKAGRIDQVAGDIEPQQVIEALADWVQDVPWKVGAESRCWEAEPIGGSVSFGYVWQDSAWVYAPTMRPRGKPTFGTPLSPSASGRTIRTAPEPAPKASGRKGSDPGGPRGAGR